MAGKKGGLRSQKVNEVEEEDQNEEQQTPNNEDTPKEKDKHVPQVNSEDEEDLLLNDRDNEVTQEQDKNIDQNVQSNPLNAIFGPKMLQEALEKVLSGIFMNSSVSQEDLQMLALDRAYITPQTITRRFQDHEKLSGRYNYKSWIEMVRLDLKAYNLLPFIEEDMAKTMVKVSDSRRVALDAQTLQYIRASLNKNVLLTMGTVKSAYEAMEVLRKNHGNDKLRDMIDLHYKWNHLSFRVGQSQARFVHDFNEIIQRFETYEIKHPDLYLVTSFIQRLDGIRDPLSPLSFFYKTLNSEKFDQLSLKELQRRFISLDIKATSSRTSSLKRLNDGARKFDNHSSRSYEYSKYRDSHRDRSSYQHRSQDSRKREAIRKPDFPKRYRDKSTEKVKPESSDKLTAKSMYDKYSAAQREQIRTMTLEEKRKARCGKCGEYFHSAEECVNKGRMCFVCYQYGHEAKNCNKNQKSSKEK